MLPSLCGEERDLCWGRAWLCLVSAEPKFVFVKQKKDLIPVDNSKFLNLSDLLESSLVLVQPRCLTVGFQV